MTPQIVGLVGTCVEQVIDMSQSLIWDVVKSVSHQKDSSECALVAQLLKQ